MPYVSKYLVSLSRYFDFLWPGTHLMPLNLNGFVGKWEKNVFPGGVVGGSCEIIFAARRDMIITVNLGFNFTLER